jgi:hypothetical protein
MCVWCVIQTLPPLTRPPRPHTQRFPTTTHATLPHHHAPNPPPRPVLPASLPHTKPYTLSTHIPSPQPDPRPSLFVTSAPPPPPPVPQIETLTAPLAALPFWISCLGFRVWDLGLGLGFRLPFWISCFVRAGGKGVE